MEGLSQIPQQGSASPQDAQADQAKRAQEEEMRRDLLATVLDTTARERLSRIALVSLDRSKQIEAILLRMAQSGQLRGRVTDAQLVDLLDQMEDHGKATGAKKSTILYQRRQDPDDDFDF